MSKIKKILLLLFVSVFVSCSNTVFEKNIEIKNGKWIYPETYNIPANIKNPQTPLNVFLNISNSEDYKYSNIFLEIKIISPDKKEITDTVDVILADYKGKWFGKKSGEEYTGRYLYKTKVAFPDTGIYMFDIKHIMRDDTLVGIKKIGLSIDKIE